MWAIESASNSNVFNHSIFKLFYFRGAKVVKKWLERFVYGQRKEYLCMLSEKTYQKKL